MNFKTRAEIEAAQKTLEPLVKGMLHTSKNIWGQYPEMLERFNIIENQFNEGLITTDQIVSELMTGDWFVDFLSFLSAVQGASRRFCDAELEKAGYPPRVEGTP